MSDLLDRENLVSQRLIINRVGAKFLKQKLFSDLDEVIDLVGVQLLGVIPEDPELAVRTAKGQPIAEESRSQRIFNAIAGRLMGEDVPLIVR